MLITIELLGIRLCATRQIWPILVGRRVRQDYFQVLDRTKETGGRPGGKVLFPTIFPYLHLQRNTQVLMSKRTTNATAKANIILADSSDHTHIRFLLGK